MHSYTVLLKKLHSFSSLINFPVYHSFLSTHQHVIISLILKNTLFWPHTSCQLLSHFFDSHYSKTFQEMSILTVETFQSYSLILSWPFSYYLLHLPGGTTVHAKITSDFHVAKSINQFIVFPDLSALLTWLIILSPLKHILQVAFGLPHSPDFFFQSHRPFLFNFLDGYILISPICKH